MSLCNGCMLSVNLTLLTSKRGTLATDARGCSLWRSLLERPPSVPESWVRDPLGARSSCGGVDPGLLHLHTETWCEDNIKLSYNFHDVPSMMKM